jgi:hypothetical protein
MPDGPYAHVAGHRFPGGTAAVPAWMNHLWCDAVACDDPPGPYVHPTLAYFAAVQGAGVGFQEIFDLLEGPSGSGVMLGEQSFVFRGPLEIDREYRVEGGITEVVRKAGRRAGVFDIATIELRVHDAEAGEPLATSTTSFVFPRREERP